MPSSPTSTPEGSPSRRVDWVPLFLPTSASSSAPSSRPSSLIAASGELVTSTILPPTQRRMSTFLASSSSSGSSESSDSVGGSSSGSLADPDSPRSAVHPYTTGTATAGQETGLGFALAAESVVQSEGVSSAVQATPLIGGGGEGVMQRSNSQQQQQQKHLRRRSGSTNNAGGFGGGQPHPFKLDPSTGAATMLRMPSLTTFTNQRAGVPPHLQHRNSTFHKALAFTNLQRRRRFISNLTRYFALPLAVLFGLYFLRRAIFSLPFLRSHPATSRAASSLGLDLPPPLSLLDTLETVPYPISSHPRTPRPNELHTLKFNQYLSTRLGSHFSFPPSTSHPTQRQQSHLWLTVADNSTIRHSATHLSSFVESLNDRFTASSSSGAPSTTPNHAELSATRHLIILCLNSACLQHCRENRQLFCYGGFSAEVTSAHDPGVLSAELARAERGIGGGKEEERELKRERVMLRGMLGALEGGRRVWWVDSGVYFKHDPLPHMAPLQHFDMQIPDTWHTGKMSASFLFLQPTANLMTLLHRLLSLSLSAPRERALWSSTNLLLDPFGQARERSPSPSSYSKKVEIDELGRVKPEKAYEGKGGKEGSFESSWEGGLDVKILAREKGWWSFGGVEGVEKVLEARKDAPAEEGKEVKQVEAAGKEPLYFHCACCGDEQTTSYLAASLGYHSPLASYPHLLPSTTDPYPAPSTSSKIPLTLHLPHLAGTPSELSFALGLLLQLASDSGRSFVPPLNVVLEAPTKEGKKREGREGIRKRIWSVFPVAQWSGRKGLGALVDVRHPGFEEQAVEFLKQHGRHGREIAELSQTLYLDLGNMRTYNEARRALKTSYFASTTRVVVENVDAVRGAEGYELRKEFKAVERSMCEEGAESSVDAEGKCKEICRI